MPDKAAGVRRSTGPISKRGKERSARNAVKHGLNVATTHISDPLFQEIAGDLLALGYGYEQTVDAANALLEYRRVMKVYNQTYWEADFSCAHFMQYAENLNHVHYSELGYQKKSDLVEAQNLFVKVANWDLKYGSLEGKRAALLKPLMRYQRSAVSRLSKALCRAR
ncbi:hypothetical protein [Marinobacterium sp. LSUCC0821]|uniref:hypothetical protein n=1 Tax=Marinobacterium sp. LSUCC0821 TaxID=2668067 RepID=UPI001451E562|nr:hypothetical protein [Marinobacterium sp. LSUCC0821]QJD72194.1 hypothetical protein HH196_11030 [Marinobacterium sp. LSUCC0821]